MSQVSAPKGIGRLRRSRILGYAAILILFVASVQMLASIFFYGVIDRQTVREDHARRVAELMVVGERVHKKGDSDAGKIMSTRHLDVVPGSWPTPDISDMPPEALKIRDRILEWEPSLRANTLILGVDRAPQNRADLVGSMRLADGTWLNFRSKDISSRWPIALRATALTVAIAVLCLLVALTLLRRLGKPFERLIREATSSGGESPVQIHESGTSDVRRLARSINDMQSRISTLVSSQARSFEAISHDLRTPLSRLKVASDFVADTDIAQIVRTSADEMEELLLSLQRFLRAQHITSEPENIDLVPELESLLKEFPGRASLQTSADRAEVYTFREPFRLALQPLIENAVQYGRHADVELLSTDKSWVIEIRDRGGGIPQDLYDRVLDPFFRLDEARARNTRGFGLGIPTASQLLRRFGGSLTFGEGVNGGLVARVVVPQAT
ncbi:hypothetical protein BH10PSE12_BH10PSE12_34670 [soil metagenome]